MPGCPRPRDLLEEVIALPGGIEKEWAVVVPGRPEHLKVDQTLAWLDLPEVERPRLIMSYWAGADNKNPIDNEIAEAMNGNLCRCGAYQRIKKGVRRAVEISKMEDGSHG